MRILNIIIALVIIFPRFTYAQDELLDGLKSLGGAALSVARNSPLGTLKTQVTSAGGSALGIIRNSPLGPSLGVAKSAIMLDRTGLTQNSINLNRQINGGLVQLGQGAISVVPSPIMNAAVPIAKDVAHGALTTGLEICSYDYLPVPKEAKTIWVGTSIDIYGTNFFRFEQRTEGMAFVGKVQRNTSNDPLKDFIVSRISSNPGLVNDKNRQLWNDQRVLFMEKENSPVLRTAVATIFNNIPIEHKPAGDMVVVSVQNKLPAPGGYFSGNFLTATPGSTLIAIDRSLEKAPNVDHGQPLYRERVVAHEFGHFFADNYAWGRLAMSKMENIRAASNNQSFVTQYGGTDTKEDFANLYAGWMVDSNVVLNNGIGINQDTGDIAWLARANLMQSLFTDTRSGNGTKVNVYANQNGSIFYGQDAPKDMREVARITANTSPNSTPPGIQAYHRPNL